MSSPPEPRNPRAGFTLLETVIAFAILSLVVGGGIVVATQSMARQARVWDTWRLSEFARAMLTEYVTTYPDLPATGRYAEIWDWRIEETPYPVEGTAELGLDLHYRRVTVVVAAVDAPDEPYALTTITARRGPGP